MRGALLEALEIGADLRDADLAGADLTRANLTGADLRDADLAGAYLRDADLTGADLTGANLTRAYLRDAYLRDADLRDADLTRADLTRADLRDARSEKNVLSIPSIANIDAAILAAVKAPGAKLEMSDWHFCETTHCRAGWAVHLAGKEGYELEKRVGPATAGALIYAASGSHPVPNFYGTNAEAMRDMEERAAAQSAE